MKTLAMTLTAAMLVLGTMAMTANAQTLPGATCLRGELVNASPDIRHVNCRGWTGRCGCGPGWVSSCPGGCCHCVPCY